MPRMIALRTHTRGDKLLHKGDEFDASEQEAREYAARTNPLAGPLQEDDPPAPAPKKRSTKATTPKAAAATKKGAKK